MAASRLELNLVRLLCRCEAMAAEKRDPDEWRLEKVRGIPRCRVQPSPWRRFLGLAGSGPDSPAPPTTLPRPFRSALPRPPQQQPRVPSAPPSLVAPPPRRLIPPSDPASARVPPLSLAHTPEVRTGHDVTTIFPPQYVGALEDMLQALKAQAR